MSRQFVAEAPLLDPVDESIGIWAPIYASASESPMQEPPFDHPARVHAWYGRLRDTAPSQDRPALVELAFANVWARAVRTLGASSLAAILDRVLLTCAAEEPILAPLHVTLEGLQCEGATAAGASPDALSAAMIRLLGDFLSLTGELTADILSPALHAVLAASPLTLHADQVAIPPVGGTGVKS